MQKRGSLSPRQLSSGLSAAGLLVYLLGAALPATSQVGSMLDQVERLADRGESREARQVLARWEREAGGSAAPEEQARGWYLAGRLAGDGAAAELHYLRVVIEGSGSAYADDALLRLGQYKHARGDFAKAIEHLGRLRRDYPTSEHGPAALLWITRAARSLGDAERACSAAEQGLREVAPNDTLLARYFREERVSCREVDRAYTVQVAAFKEELAAQRLARALLSEGYDAWVLSASPNDPLYRVRVGRGLTEAEAQVLIDRMARAGHSPFLVSQTLRYDEGR